LGFCCGWRWYVHQKVRVVYIVIIRLLPCRNIYLKHQGSWVQAEP
jgi:hypothetical protein